MSKSWNQFRSESVSRSAFWWRNRRRTPFATRRASCLLRTLSSGFSSLFSRWATTWTRERAETRPGSSCLRSTNCATPRLRMENPHFCIFWYVKYVWFVLYIFYALFLDTLVECSCITFRQKSWRVRPKIHRWRRSRARRKTFLKQRGSTLRFFISIMGRPKVKATFCLATATRNFAAQDRPQSRAGRNSGM